MSYAEKFLDVHVMLPVLSSEEQEKFLERSLRLKDYKLDYQNYSVLFNPFRKFPYLTAANIDGKRFRKINRPSDSWKKDARIPKDQQLGMELYGSDKSDFDRGHMTKREDVQWGASEEEALEAAKSTFYYTNAIPQVAALNRKVWRRIEDYVLHSEVVSNQLKISMFTGPVFTTSDPKFVTPVNEEDIQLPVFFWKVVYYKKRNELHRTAFLTGQEKSLRKDGIIPPIYRGEATPSNLFMGLKDAATYQVRVELIERWTGLSFAHASEAYKDHRAEKIIEDEVNVRGGGNEGLRNVLNIVI